MLPRELLLSVISRPQYDQLLEGASARGKCRVKPIVHLGRCLLLAFAALRDQCFRTTKRYGIDRAGNGCVEFKDAFYGKGKRFSLPERKRTPASGKL